MTGHLDDKRCDDYVPEPFLVKVDPNPDQCRIAGHGDVFVTFRADLLDFRMRLSADCDELEAVVQIRLGEVETLCGDLVNAVRVIRHEMTRTEFEQIIADREPTQEPEQTCQSPS